VRSTVRREPDVGVLHEAKALEALQLDWGNAWNIGRGAGRWQAARRDGTGHVLTRASAAGLAMALRISHGRAW
jgi:hypothetical protein